MVWQRRQFILASATARNVSMYTEAQLGQLWQVLTPLLNSCVYYLIFGIIFEANRGISNTPRTLFPRFIFSFTERSIVTGSNVMRANITLIRALQFPRACLPLAYVLVEFQLLLLLQATFNMGAAADAGPDRLRSPGHQPADPVPAPGVAVPAVNASYECQCHGLGSGPWICL